MVRAENVNYVWRTVIRNGRKVRVRMNRFKVDLRSLPMGRGSRFYVKHTRYLTQQLKDIKHRQDLAERKAGMRVGSGLFDNPLSQSPQVIGRLYTPRHHQKNPYRKKIIRLRKGLSPYPQYYKKTRKPRHKPVLSTSGIPF